MLRDAGIDTPALDASVLLAHALRIDRAMLYARTDAGVAPDIEATFRADIVRRAAHVPVAYLTGTKEFFGLPLAVTPDVLVPRPETELLVAWAVAWLRGHPGDPRVLDVGTGSGAIAVAVAHETPTARVIASDISVKVVCVARLNAQAHHVYARVSLVCGDLLVWCGQRVDLILANLPYLTDAEATDPSLSAEPTGALVGENEDGFGLYRALIPQALELLAPGGALAFEIGAGQAVAAVRTVEVASAPNAVTVTVHADLAGLPRFVTVERANERA